MNDERIVEQFKLLKRAKKLEEMGNVDRALALYMELHEKYDPNTSDAYERPAIILERKRKYEEALSFCKKAIDQIEKDKISGTKEKFEKRIQHIEEKLASSPKAIVVKAQESYTFGIIGFRSHNKSKKITASTVYILFIALGIFMKSPYFTAALIGIVYFFTYFVDLFKSPKKVKIPLFILLLLTGSLVFYATLQLPDAFNEALSIEDKTEHLEGGENIFKDDVKRPEITAAHIADAQKIIDSEVEVIESVIIVNESTIAFGLLLQPNTNKEKAISLSESFVEILAHQVSKDASIKAPGFNSLGELYDFYSITISAGSDATAIIAKGSKSTSSKFITWRD